MFSDDDGKLAVRIARNVVEHHVKKEKLPDFTVP